MTLHDPLAGTAIDEIMAEIAELGATLSVDGPHIRLRAPKGNIGEGLRERIRVNRDAIIAFLLNRDRKTRLPLVRVNRQGPLALSFAQQRLWFLDQLEPGSAFYNIPAAVRLRGVLDVDALRGTLNEVVRRHEALRTRFATVDGTPVQVIAPELSVPLEVADLGALEPELTFDEREQRAVDLAREEAARPFDLSAGPLLRASLVRLAERDHLLLFTLHHIVSDGWSTGVLVREVAALYGAYVAGRPTPLPDLAIQYADYAHWQREYLSGGVLENHVGYWRKQLSDAPELLLLPTDRPRPAAQSYRGSTYRFEIAPELTRGLRELSRRTGATLFMTLTAALNVLLSRYSRQKDICLGTPIANRKRDEIESLIGFFVNTLVLRTRLEGDPSFLELLEQVRRTALEAYEHQDVPFEHLVEVLKPERHLSHAPLFQVMIALQNAPTGALELPGLVLEQVTPHANSSKFDLTFYFADASGDLSVEVEYSTDLFDASTIERMARHLRVLLDGIVARPAARIGALDLLTEGERRQILREWNATEVAYPQDRRIHELFEAQAARTPDATAVAHENETLSYGELNARANRLAHYLRGRGVGPDVLVGLCTERSLEMLVGLLGILKAGGAYVPLDPNYPAERLTYMLSDAAPALVLTQADLVERLRQPGGGVAVFCLDRDWPALDRCPATNPAAIGRAQNLAYVIYTSGSTGKPKGVAITHGSAAVFTAWAQEAFTPAELAGVLASTSICFDLSVFEIFVPLSVGGTVVLARTVLDLPARPERANAVTLINTVPSAMGELIRSGFALPNLRVVNLAGEALPGTLVDAIYRETEVARVLNLYGPSEDTTYSTFAEIAPDEQRQPPIGRPISNTQLYILDDALQPVPIGAAGELHIAGAGLARGYLNRPDLTAEKFIPNPYGPAGTRMYCTGDLARYLPDGNVEYLGRLDAQVKVRGYRIELGEIETALAAVSGVREAVVLAREDQPGDRRLVAYVVTDPAQEDAAASLEDGHVADLRQVFDQIYDELSAAADPTFNLSGWKSSYDQQPIPAEEMKEWVEETVAGVDALKPDKVLEIGCGTGLLLHRLAPACSRYWGTDFSGVALDELRRSLGKPDQASCEIRLLERRADDFAGLAPEFDTVVINSVVQYFPSLSYLTDVIEGALSRIGGSGGHVFVGDVRHAGLLELFHTSVALHHAAPSLPLKQIRQLVMQNVRREAELLVDPGYFFALARRDPRISHIEIMPKKARAANELTRFRYDVVISVGTPGAALAPRWRRWSGLPGGVADVERILSQEAPEHLALRDIPQGRLAEARLVHELLQALPEDGSVADLRREFAGSTGHEGVDPADLEALGSRHGYRVTFGMSSGGEGGVHAVFQRAPRVVDWSALHPSAAEAGDLRRLVHQPYSPQWEAAFRKSLPHRLQQSLPEYMVPSHFVVLDALPLTANGKVDRKALPAPDLTRGEIDYVAPRDGTEEVVAGIWAEVLGLDKVGVHDNFFALGGHSLLATQVIAKVRARFETDLALRALFEAPTVAGLSQRIEAARRGERTGFSATPIVPVPREGSLALSFAQNRFWFLDQYQPGSPLYGMRLALTLKGRWDTAVLTRVFSALVERHETLRTTFTHQDGVPKQVIAPAGGAFTLPIEDFTGLPPDAAEAAIQQRIRDEAATPFDLAKGPLLRVGLLKVGDEEHVLLLALHHILYDGWSIHLLIDEIIALYDAFALGRPSPLAPLPIQYADYCHWEQQQLSGPALERLLGYWRTRLAGAPELMQLPTDRPRPAVATFNGATYRTTLSAELTQRLAALGQEHHATLFMAVAASFKTLFHRLCGQNDLCVTSQSANRPHGTEALIGIFVNLITLRSTIGAGSSFADVLKDTSQEVVAAHDYPIPFELVLTHLTESRDASYMPYAQVALNFHSEADRSQLVDLPAPKGLDVEVRGGGLDVQADFEIKVEMYELESGGLSVEYVYNTDLFDEATIARWHRYLERVAGHACVAPESRVRDFPLLSQAERRQIVVSWNDTATEYPRERCLHDYVTVQAGRTPDAIAAVCGDRQLSYAELDRRSNQLAHHLIGLGIGPETAVGLCVERSLDLVVGLLGILKAGGVYLPLDPSYPPERLAYMLEDVQAAVLLTQARMSEQLPAHWAHEVRLDDGWADIARQPDHAPVSGATSDNLAYIIYTSGSTGKPKGVGVTHASALNFIFSVAHLGPLPPGVSQSWWTSVGFDLSIFEAFAPFVEGGRLEIVPDALRGDLEQFIDWIRVRKLGSTYVPASAVERLAQAVAENPEEWNFRRLILGVEPIPGAVVRDLRNTLPGLEIINGYGPTEATICATLYPVPPGDIGSITPIGRPVWNTQIYLLDDEWNPVPVGVSGELFIGGAQLARGYLGKPDLTAERFVPSPFGNGERLYRTGDLARWRTDGNIEFLGRIDHQVKLRGYRIELGEIEAALTALPGVRETVVLAREDQPGEKWLVAYVVGLAAAGGIDVAALRAALGRSLPEYMVPSHIVVLDELPLTANGKVDRKALPAPDLTRGEAGYVTPRSKTEEIVAGIWSEVLGLDRVGVHDNFFDLGGHSLVATQVVTRLRATFGVELPLRALFETPSVAELCEWIDAAKVDEGAEPAIPAPTAYHPRPSRIPLSYSQERLWLLEQIETLGSTYNLPAAVRLSGTFSDAAFEQALHEIVRRHESLRTRFAVAEEGSPEQVIDPPDAFRLERIDLSAVKHDQRSEEAGRRARRVAEQPFDLARGPLFRAALLRLAPDDHVAIVVMHHIVSDGWSASILIREIGALYTAYVEGRPSPLPELPIQYADYALWQRSWLRGEALERQIRYWTERLAGAPPVLDLPTDRPRPMVQNYQGAILPFAVPKELSDSLAALAHREGATLFMMLLAAFQIVLSHWSGQQDIVVGTPVAGRTDHQTEGLIGFFLNMLALRTDLSGDPSFRVLLRRARETALGAFAHQDLPFEKLVEELNPARDLSRPPVFQVVINSYSVDSSSLLTLPGLEVSSVSDEEVGARFELMLRLSETDAGVACWLEYATALFDAATIERLAGHFRTVLEGIVANPNARLSELPLLSEAERHQLLVEWNATAAAYPGGQCIHDLFAEQAARTPDATAVVASDGERLSYGELDARANRLAHYLQSLGVGPEIVVGLCLERSPNLLVGLLGILKAGGAYLRLDPGNPQDRAGRMIRDAKVGIVVTQQALESRLLDHDEVRLARLDADWPSIATASSKPPRVSAVHSGNLAYVVYPSKAAERLRGLACTHAGAVNQLRADAAAPTDELAVLARLISGEGFRFGSSPTTRDGGGGGERRTATLLHGITLLPAEEGAISLGFGDGAASWGRRIRRGRPIPNVRAYVLDADSLVLAPAGVTGELYVGGLPMARGYFGRPDLTAEAFIPDPFEPGARLYRTGELARWREGCLELVGRLDRRITLRGYAIELGAVEDALSALPGVREAVVTLAREEQFGSVGGVSLIGYVVGEPGGPALEASSLRDAVRRLLPEYMVPAHIVPLAALPLTADGEVDVDDLPSPSSEEQPPEQRYVEPSTPTEEALAEIWLEVLGVERIGTRDNFFDLGGHSLLATLMAARLREVFGIELPLRTLFEAPTIAALADVIDNIQWTRSEQETAEVGPHESGFI